jgi:hypothetical protein
MRLLTIDIEAAIQQSALHATNSWWITGREASISIISTAAYTCERYSPGNQLGEFRSRLRSQKSRRVWCVAATMAQSTFLAARAVNLCKCCNMRQTLSSKQSRYEIHLSIIRVLIVTMQVYEDEQLHLVAAATSEKCSEIKISLWHARSDGYASSVRKRATNTGARNFEKNLMRALMVIWGLVWLYRKASQMEILPVG